jgi:hypothetical protein
MITLSFFFREPMITLSYNIEVYKKRPFKPRAATRLEIHAKTAFQGPRGHTSEGPAPNANWLVAPCTLQLHSPGLVNWFYRNIRSIGFRKDGDWEYAILESSGPSCLYATQSNLRLPALMDLYIHPLYVLVSKILSSILNFPASIHPLSTLFTVGPTYHFI